jgi:hypothetical protein
MCALNIILPYQKTDYKRLNNEIKATVKDTPITTPDNISSS